MSLVLLAGYMNTYTSNPAPIDPTGGFAGNTVTPFDYGTCPCHAAVQRSRDLVSVQRAATLAQSDQTAVAVNRSSNIVWTGKAADLFRSRLSRTAQYSASLAQDMEPTHRLAWGSSCASTITGKWNRPFTAEWDMRQPRLKNMPP